MIQRGERSRRVGLVVPYGELTVLPSVVNSAELLAEAGYRVDVIATRRLRFSAVPPHRFVHPAIRVIWSDPGLTGQVPAVGWWAATRRLTASIVKLGRQEERYRCLFGVDAEGLIAATWASRRLRVPVVYHSLEIELVAGELRVLLQALRQRHSPLPVLLRRFAKNRLSALLKKPLERWAHRRAAFTVALDDVRAAALLADNRVPDGEVLILPTAPLALRREPDRQYLRRKYNLPADRTVLLQIGGISDVARSLELVQAAGSWPATWTLILHGFAADPQYLLRLREMADGHRVIVSTELVPYDELDDLVASADIGLALYRGIDLNYIHMASGKLLQYLKCGLPVIATDFPNLRRILHEHECGICVPNETGVLSAASRILENPQRWADAARRCFRDHYDFASHFARVQARVAEL
jgi:glycosyltransferase involved in cell wall biosynthesis